MNMDGRVRVKICGVTRTEDALAAVQAGVDAIGLNFVPSTARVIDAETAARIAEAVAGRAELWGVFVDEDPGRVRQCATQVGLTRVQLHGDESPDAVDRLADLSVVKAIRVRDAESLSAFARYRPWGFLLDTYSESLPGGTGKSFDWSLLAGRERNEARLVLSGGLGPDNVCDAVRTVRPDWVDAASGVESSPGVKDHELVRRFVEAAREGCADD